MRIRRSVRTSLCNLLPVLLSCCLFYRASAQTALTASLRIDASKIENAISPTLYGQFAEFMFQDIKGGLFAELVRDRGFNEAPNALGLPRYWERDPDDRNDDGNMKFAWDGNVYSPVHSDQNTLPAQHSLQLNIARDDGQRRGIRRDGSQSGRAWPTTVTSG